MKFLELRLLAYGPFRDLTLDFSNPASRIHVLHGRNEAGKSTTLRAVMGLLYGIPKSTVDAHVHPFGDLRIGARLLASDGAILDVVRKKGNKNTLLDPKGEPIDEAVLKRMLGSVGEELYRTTFGLDHETLREGGKSLLLGKGDLGESLFQAGLGGSEVHHVLAQLRKEAEDIFTARAHTRPLNEALKAHSDALRRVKDSEQSADAWIKQTEAIEKTEAELQSFTKERTELILEQKRAQRTRRVLPILGKRAHLLAQQKALGAVFPLAEDAKNQRMEALRERDDADNAEKRLTREVAEIGLRLAKLVVPDSLVDLGEKIEELHGRLGAHKKAAADHPRLRIDLERSEGETRRILRRIGRDLPLEEAEALRLDVATQARIRKLARDHVRFDDQTKQALRAVADAEVGLLEKQARALLLDAPRDGEPLRRAVDRARQQGDLEERACALRSRTQKLQHAAEAKKRALGIWSGALSEAPALPVPSLESVERFVAGDAARAIEEAHANARAQELEQELANLSRATDAVLRGGAVPTEEELDASRARRDVGWHQITTAWKNGTIDASAPMVAAYEQRVHEADALSDRLRREAARVTNLSQLLAGKAAADAAAARLGETRRALEARAREDLASWRALWEPSGIRPLSPVEMRAWLGRHAALVVAVEQLHAAKVDLADLEQRIALHREEILLALRVANEPSTAPDMDLASLVARGERLATVIETTARERRETDEASAAKLRELERCKRDRDACATALGQWSREWMAAIAPLGLDSQVAPEEAAAVLDELVDLFRCLDDATKTRRRVMSIERDAVQFAGDVAQITTQHAPDLVGLACEEAASQLYARYQRGKQDRDLRAQHDADIEDKRRALAEHAERAARAGGTLSMLMRAARVETLEELENAERRDAMARALKAEITAVEEQLLDAGEGATVDDLLRESASHGADEVAARLDAIETRLRELEEELLKSSAFLGSCRGGLATLSGESGAADAAAEAQEELARVRRHVERYVRVRLAAIILSREIERYREKNQAPVLGLASDLFRRLTLGGHTGLRTGFHEDQAVLRCVRNDGREVDVEGLSDGTRDQLYLALRLASLERHARSNEAIPLVFDDILIHFDDDRARAALEILGQFAQHTQILFFTHHARLVALAREALPAAILGIHELGESPARVVAAEAQI